MSIEATPSEPGGRSVQEEFFPELTCFGCGPANARGLQLRSHADADGTVRATFAPWPEHDNGVGYLNGGIIATLLDCHSAAAVAVASRALGVGWSGSLAYVTAGLDVRYLRPSPLLEPAELVARITSASEEEMHAETELHWQGKPRAVATAVRKRWRPRTADAARPH